MDRLREILFLHAVRKCRSGRPSPASPGGVWGLVALGRSVMGNINLNVRNMERAGAGKDVEFACRSGFFGSVGLCWRRLFLNFAP